MKRAFDITAASLAIVLLSPLLVCLMLTIYLYMGWPIWFCQLRPGKGEKSFRLIKFRTMSVAQADAGNSLPDAQRLTGFGRFLRATSLDELPELWNILRGDMSIIGPRPLLMEYLPLYNSEQARRHEVRPGITGWAQVNGRNALSWEDKFKLDVWYVENQSFWLDVKILLLTVLKVIKREGIHGAGEATMSKFTGVSAGGREGK